MHYKLLTPPTTNADHTAEELRRLLTHAKRLVVTFATVAGRYKTQRARLTLITVPDALAGPAERALQIVSGRDDALVVSADVVLRPEWTIQAMLSPTEATAPALDGTLLDGWDSACLTVTYTSARVQAMLRCCAEDAERLTRLSLSGWTVRVKPNPMVVLLAGGAWTGVPSLLPVPGGVAPKPSTLPDLTIITEAERIPHPPMLLDDELDQVLTEDVAGLLIGVAPDGQPIRLAPRAMTVALDAPPETRASAVIALMRRAMSSGMGLIVALDRTLLPSEMLAAWEARIRLLDVQDVAASCAIRWRDTPPAFLAHALGSRTALARVPAQPGELLTTLGARALCTPGVLGLLAAPGDDLRGVLAAGGLIIIPQDGDAASQAIARLLLASLTPSPSLVRPVMLLCDSTLVAPEELRQQIITVVAAPRPDALIRLVATAIGWDVRAPDGRSLATLLPDLMAQPTIGAGALIETIVAAIQPDTHPGSREVSSEPPAWWESGDRTDALDEVGKAEDVLADPLISVILEAAGSPVPIGDPTLLGVESPELLTNPISATLVMPVEMHILPEAAGSLIPIGDPALLDEQVSADDASLTDWLALMGEPLAPLSNAHDADTPLDTALATLLDALMADDPTGVLTDCITAGDDDTARMVLDLADPADLSTINVWRVVLATDDVARLNALMSVGMSEDAPFGPLLLAVAEMMPNPPMIAIPDTPSADSQRALLTALIPGTPQEHVSGIGHQDARSPDVEPHELDGFTTTDGRHDESELDEWAALAMDALSEELQAGIGHQDGRSLDSDVVRVVMAPNQEIGYQNARSIHTGDAAAIRTAWQGGMGIPQLISQLTAMGMHHAEARTTIKAAIAESVAPVAPAAISTPTAISTGSPIPISDPADQPTLTPDQVGKLLGVSGGRVRSLIRSGKLAATKDALGVNRIAPTEVRHYQASIEVLA